MKNQRGNERLRRGKKKEKKGMNLKSLILSVEPKAWITVKGKEKMEYTHSASRNWWEKYGEHSVGHVTRKRGSGELLYMQK